jgi:hypothetical protein
MKRNNKRGGNERPVQQDKDHLVRRTTDIIDDVLEFTNTTQELLIRFSRSKHCCAEPQPADAAKLSDALRKATQPLLKLRAKPLDPKSAPKVLWDAYGILRDMRLPRLEPGTWRGLPLRVPVDSLLLTVSGTPNLLASSFGAPLGDIELGPGDVSRGLDALIQFLEGLLNDLGDNPNAFEIRRELEALIDELRAYDEVVRAEHLGIDLEEFLRIAREYLERAFEILRQYGAATGAIAAAIRNQIQALIARLMALFGGGEAGGATAGFAIRAGLYALAFYIGHLIGKWIGKQQIDGRTINDWLTDALYYEYFAIADECLDLEAAYYGAAKARRDYEKSGPTLDRSVMLALLSREYSLLLRLRETAVRKRCFDDVSGFDKELERLKERYRRLAL